ncbi:uncharacterized protein [Littorina saxatilis]|uniref:uncharacterized protein n=1 Tax=Littorina saxatilis TaxID=31220 RepID=UPI0038B6A409
MASRTESSSDRIARWRSLAEELGVKSTSIPEFIAERMTREDAEQARLELEKEKLELERKAYQDKLEVARRETDERVKYVQAQRETDEKAAEEKQRQEREDHDRKQKQEGEEHDLRMQLLQRESESKRVKRGSRDGADNEGDSSGEEESSDLRGFRPSIPMFDESKENIATWLKRFERVATLYKWKRNTWATRVSTRLSGRAVEVYNTLDDDSADDYDGLKVALLGRYQLTAETYRRRLRTCKRKEHETFRQFGARIEENLTKWHELSEITELKQLVLLEQFLQTLSADMAAYVKEKKPQTLAEAVKSAEIHFEAHRDSKKFFQHDRDQGGKAGVGEKQKSGDNSVGTSGRKCFICESPKHLARDCPKKSKSTGAVNSGPEKSLPPVSVPTLCTPCSQQDYDPRCLVVVDGVAVEGLRDTGSQVCVVKSSLVSRSQFTGQDLEVSMAEKDIKRRYPVIKVQVECPFYTGEVEAIVMDTPVADFIVGNHARLGDSIVLPVYAVSKVVSVVTRAQAAAEGKKSTLLHVAAPGLETVTPEQLHDLQRNDSTLKSCREAADRRDVRTSGHSGEVGFVWKKKILYREYRGGGSVYTQVVVPQQLRLGVIKLAHEPPMGGHMGVQRTRDRVWQQFFWPGMCADIRRFVLSCDQCQKVSHKPQKVPLGKMPLIDTPFERVAIDLVGPIIPASESGNRYILVFVDYATRYPEAIPLKSIEAVKVAEAMWAVWTRVGIPSEILTDRGTQFMSEVMKEVERLLAIKGLATTPYHAQGNGLVERYNGTLKTMLRKLAQEKPKQWDRYIPALLFAYREVPQESLGFSPFELLYGRTVRGPMSVLRNLWTEEQVDEQVRTTSEYVVDLRNRIEETCKLARQNLSAAAQKHAEVFNRKTVRRQFQPGDKVLLLLPQKKNKLQLCWQGPFDVLEKKGESDYRIRIYGREKLYHANLLKLYRDRQNTADPSDGIPTVAVAVVEETEEMISPDRELPLPCLEGEETVKDINLSATLTAEQRRQVLEIAERHERVLTDVPLQTPLAVFDMTVESAKPVRVKQYPLPYAKVETIKEEVQAMKKLGVIETAASPYNAPVVLIRKKDGKVRFCVDYRRLNDVTVFDAEPLPDVEHLFAGLGRATYFSKFDLSKGYWQIPIRDDVRPMTAFTTPVGQFQFTVMPFGLKNAVAVFSRMMRALLEPLGRNDVHNFMDDILVATETWKEHLAALEAVLRRLEQANLSARPMKCFVGFEELSFLGHVVRKGEILPEDNKLQKIDEAPVPETKKQVRAFLGLAGYYRKFIPNFSAIALPLSDLTKKNSPNTVVWTAECEKAFRALKARLTSKPVLQLPDLSQPFTLRTDASDHGLGAVLMQEKDGVFHPVAYASRKLSTPESKYSTIERECLAVVWATQKFQPFLYGQTFVLETDHQPLRYLQTAKVVNSRLMRWSLLLQAYSFTVRVIPGSRNVGADYLSRACVEEGSFAV